jgi:NitT/TauT family transport system ATP-binding protein
MISLQSVPIGLDRTTPFAAVYAQTRTDLGDLVRHIWQKLSVTIIFITHDIDESVYLGEWVLMLSNSPTVVKEDLTIVRPVDVDQLTTRSSERFNDLRGPVHEQIQLAKSGTLSEPIAETKKGHKL